MSNLKILHWHNLVLNVHRFEMANIIYNAANPSGGFSVYINGQPVSHGLSQQEATDFLGRFYDALDGRLRILVEVDDDDESDSS